MFIISRIENMMYEVTFDPLKRKGKIIVNISIVNEPDLKKVIGFIRQAVHSGLSVSPYIKIIRAGEKFGNLTIEKGKVDRKSTRLNSSHIQKSRMPSSA